MAKSFFIAHGSPMLAIQDNEYTRELKRLGDRLGSPEAVIVFSAHWIARPVTVTSTHDVYETIYDFGGFPDEMYTLKYNARGSVDLAREMIELFRSAGLDAAANTSRGLDHGAWVILRHMFPKADIPVINVSVNPTLPPDQQYKIGAALSSLKDRNIVIIGSGATVHNFRMMNLRDPERVDEWAKEFDDWLIGRMEVWNTAELFDYARLAPYAKEATPDYEHFLPLFIAMGSGDRKKQATLLHQSYQYGSLSHIIVEYA
ncbi:DODA-type extradiol aromatic ring-opening family dioxygenase [Paenibacillus hamazuiensis]|uniref:DODA-type extradiol aromatic ring-opening family dioxygenase n=1 Tax=Paenibacillus hamazuiensis TaxID=2936508 RepID=UPI0020105FC2|nr:class III extradiol ring-cleavage dioxygenase [Paenibacillus hamazuiensis]